MLINFSHPITPAQISQIKEMSGNREVDVDVRDVRCQIDLSAPLHPQVVALVDSVGLSPVEWQTTPFLVNLPGMAIAAVAILVEIHGRCGYYPPCLRLRQMNGSVPPVYEVAEIVDLQSIRNEARNRR